MRITYEEKVFESNKPVKVNEILKNDITLLYKTEIVYNLCILSPYNFLIWFIIIFNFIFY